MSKKRMTAYTIDFEPVGRRGQCPADKTLLDCARQLGVGLVSICGGRATCHACKVQVVDAGTLTPTQRDQFLATVKSLAQGGKFILGSSSGLYLDKHLDNIRRLHKLVRKVQVALILPG